MRVRAETRNRDGLAEVLGLAVYGIVFLPHLNDYIDLAAIDAFLATKERGLSPTVAILANTYYSLQCHDGRGGQLTCCIPALSVSPSLVQFPHSSSQSISALGILMAIAKGSSIAMPRDYAIATSSVGRD
ncbi:hypothetical protein CR513_20444, partial [Mucuna pruriens]